MTNSLMNQTDMQFISEEQKRIVLDNARLKLVNGCAGGYKTSSLIKCGVRHLSEGKNVLFLTKISSVTDEITKRMTRDYNLIFTKSASHFIGQYSVAQNSVAQNSVAQNSVAQNSEVTGAWCSVANYDSFIDKQLRKYSIPFEGEAFNAKVKKLSENIEKITDGVVMKNDVKVDVILIDEVQDFDKLRVVFTTQLFNQLPHLIGIFVGDTLQTVFIQSIMDESFSMNYLKCNLDCKYYELSTCYRCPKGQIDFVNKVMAPYTEKYCIEPMKSHNNNLIDKPVIFQHHSVHKEYERSDLCNRVIYIVDYVLNNDITITPDDIVVVMNKTNSNAVFEKLLVALNTYYKARFNGKNYEHVIHYKTKNHEGRKTIDWSIGECKTKFISVHGIKGKGQKVVILLGMSEKSIPMVEWLFKTEELVSQSVMNVALTRSEKYLFVGVNSIPSRYINDQMSEIEKGLAYCTWNKETWQTADPFYKRFMEGFSQFESFKFIEDKYTKEIVYTPSKSVLAIKEDIVQEYHISDCIKNAFALMESEVMTKSKFGKRCNATFKMNIVERAVMGIMCELLVQRHMRIKTKTFSYDNAFLVNYYSNSHGIMFTNNQGLLNVVFDSKLNNYVKNEKRWFVEFSKIKENTKHLKWIKAELAKIKSPTYILDNVFDKIQLKTMLGTYFGNAPNESINSSVFWNLALFHTALSGHFKMGSVMMYVNGFNKNISQLHKNVEEFCDKFLINKQSEFNISFGKEINVIKKVSDPDILLTINPELLKAQAKEEAQGKEAAVCGDDEKKETKKKRKSKSLKEGTYRYGIMGISDIVLENKLSKKSILHELKCISCSDIAKVKTWIFQSILYSYLLKKLNKKEQNDVDTIIITNILSGTMWRFDMTKINIKFRETITWIMKEKKFPQVLIDMFLE